jgi:hypothetical protein
VSLPFGIIETYPVFIFLIVNITPFDVEAAGRLIVEFELIFTNISVSFAVTVFVEAVTVL